MKFLEARTVIGRMMFSYDEGSLETTKETISFKSSDNERVLQRCNLIALIYHPDMRQTHDQDYTEEEKSAILEETGIVDWDLFCTKLPNIGSKYTPGRAEKLHRSITY